MPFPKSCDDKCSVSFLSLPHTHFQGGHAEPQRAPPFLSRSPPPRYCPPSLPLFCTSPCNKRIVVEKPGTRAGAHKNKQSPWLAAPRFSPPSASFVRHPGLLGPRGVGRFERQGLATIRRGAGARS